jgi:hypothetical protein
LDELNKKLAAHLIWSNKKTMRTRGRKSPLKLLNEKPAGHDTVAPMYTTSYITSSPGLALTGSYHLTTLTIYKKIPYTLLTNFSARVLLENGVCSLIFFNEEPGDAPKE